MHLVTCMEKIFFTWKSRKNDSIEKEEKPRDRLKAQKLIDLVSLEINYFTFIWRICVNFVPPLGNQVNWSSLCIFCHYTYHVCIQKKMVLHKKFFVYINKGLFGSNDGRSKYIQTIILSLEFFCTGNLYLYLLAIKSTSFSLLHS